MVGLSAHERALADQDVVSMAGGVYKSAKISIGSDNIVRFDNYQEPFSYLNQYIDLGEKNAVTDAIETVRKLSTQDIIQDKILQEVLNKPEWTYDDRTTWESRVSNIVSARFDEIPGLDSYRNAIQYDGVTRITDFKDMAPDIENGTSLFEYDCETTRSLEGIVLTLLEQEEAKLSDQTLKNDNYKVKSNYIAVNAGVKFSINTPVSDHAFLMSSLTGNIIEGAADPKRDGDWGTLAYRDTGKEFSYADMVAGKLAVSQSIYIASDDPSNASKMVFSLSVYGTRHGEGDADVIQRRQELIEKQDFDALGKPDSLISRAREGLFGGGSSFDRDSKEVNEEYFKSAFEHKDDVIFTVQKPQGKLGSAENKTEIPKEKTQEDTFNTIGDLEKEKTLEDVLFEKDDLSKDLFDKAFFDKMHDVLEENGFKESGKPVILQTKNGDDYLLHKNSEGKVGVYDVTGDKIKNVPTLEFKVEDKVTEPPAPPVKPEPQTIETCPQLRGASFYEFVDGHGILNDKGKYNDADMLKNMIHAAKELGLSENVYGHIEGAMDGGKFLETASSIRAISASHDALKGAQAEGLNNIDQERMVVKTFFENITEESLIVDTEGFDDKTPYSKEELEKVREMAEEMDGHFFGSTECQVSELQGNFTGAAMPDSVIQTPAQNDGLNVTAPDLVPGR